MNAEVGIIGGMGPMASELFYKMVTEHTKADSDQDHINMILLSDASMPDRTEAILSNEYEAPRKQLLNDALLLQNIGCKEIVVTCNTAHFFVDMIQSELEIPVLHMIRLTVDKLALECPNEKIGIMATNGTIQTALYQKCLEEKGLRWYVPEKEIQSEVMHQIYDCIKAGEHYDADSWKKIEADYKTAGCRSVILACTELSVIKAQENLPDWYVDPMLTLAQTVVETSGKTWKT